MNPVPEKTNDQETRSHRMPLVDIYETEKEYVIKAEMPGSSEENIDVHFHKGELSITGKYTCGSCCSKTDKNKRQYRIRQFEKSDFYRNFRIGDSVQTDAIAAHYQDGILSVRLPKSEAIMPKKIAIGKC